MSDAKSDCVSGESERSVDFFDLLRARRSIRSYSKEPVPDELVQKMLEAGRLAPSRANSQPWHFVVIRDPAVKQAMYSAVYHQSLVVEAPLLISVLGIIDPRPTVPSRTFELVQAGCFSNQVKDFADHVLDNWDESALQTDAALNAAIAGTHVMLAAHALGLGCCWVKLCRDDEVLRLLGVPTGFYHAGTLAIGFPGEDPRARPRLPLTGMVSYEQFGRREPAR
jgi:nitroreductase